MTKKTVHLLIIDPQNDFCDLPEDFRGGNTPALPVAGAHADMLRLAALIRLGGQRITEISVTLDSHQRLDIAHPGFWRQGNGEAVAPFTPIHADEVRAGRFLPRGREDTARVLAYLDLLEAAGRYTHMVWPVHCELGSWGHNVHEAVRAAYNAWEETGNRRVEKILKGMHPWTEHYSAIRAEVPDPAAPETLDNDALLARLAVADRILIAGEAGSHCIKATTEHLVDDLPDAARRLTLIVDCMSPVAGFEAGQSAFIAAMRATGARIAHAEELLAELTDNAAAPGNLA
ncbi:MAG: cysteine hydrolase [Zoogloeaceae bacterium]|nr:cysteine hydrolase [Zoogloeaceae bacterium]